MSNQIPLFYIDVITYPCPKLHAGLAHLYQLKRPLWPLLLTWINFNPNMDK